MRDEIVERVRLALAASPPGQSMAQAAITALLDAMETPTPGMMKAVEDEGLEYGAPSECYRVDLAAIWSAMINQLRKEVEG